MKKIFAILVFAFALAIPSHAAGIEFFHGTWAEGVARASTWHSPYFHNPRWAKPTTRTSCA